jgi:hypothetical protein
MQVSGCGTSNSPLAPQPPPPSMPTTWHHGRPSLRTRPPLLTATGAGCYEQLLEKWACAPRPRPKANLQKVHVENENENSPQPQPPKTKKIVLSAFGLDLGHR